MDENNNPVNAETPLTEPNSFEDNFIDDNPKFQDASITGDNAPAPEEVPNLLNTNQPESLEDLDEVQAERKRRMQEQISDEEWKRYVKEYKQSVKLGKIKPKLPSETMLEESGLIRKRSFTSLGIEYKDTNGDTVLKLNRTGSHCSIPRSSLTNKDIIFAACQSVADSGRKVIHLTPATPSSKQEIEKFFILGIEGAIATGKYDISTIKLADKRYNYLLERYKDSLIQTAGIGGEDKKYTQTNHKDDPQRDAENKEEQNIDKFSDEIKYKDALYNLHKATAIAEKKISKINGWTSYLTLGSDSKKFANNIKKDKDAMFWQPKVKSAVAAQRNLNSEINKFCETVEKMKNPPEESVEAYRMAKAYLANSNKAMNEFKVASMSSSTLAGVQRVAKVLEGSKTLRHITEKQLDFKPAPDGLKLLQVFAPDFVKINKAMKNDEFGEINARMLNGDQMKKTFGLKVGNDIKHCYAFNVKGSAGETIFFEDKKGRVMKVDSVAGDMSKATLSTLTMKQVIDTYNKTINYVPPVKPVVEEPKQEEVKQEEPKAAEMLKEPEAIKAQENIINDCFLLENKAKGTYLLYGLNDKAELENEEIIKETIIALCEAHNIEPDLIKGCWMADTIEQSLSALKAGEKGENAYKVAYDILQNVKFEFAEKLEQDETPKPEQVQDKAPEPMAEARQSPFPPAVQVDTNPVANDFIDDLKNGKVDLENAIEETEPQTDIEPEGPKNKTRLKYKGSAK